MGAYKLIFKPIGFHALLIEWPNEVNDLILDDIIQFAHQISRVEKNEMCNYASGYNSILIDYKGDIDFKLKTKKLQSLYHNSKYKKTLDPRTWKIPVCYNEEYGPDLGMYRQKGLDILEVVKMHTSMPYRVYMIGFLPGFLYLGGLQKSLHLPRKETPRQHVPKGSVAIGGKQTGIYPNNSPGGWQIIGRTPLTLFDINKELPVAIKQGDYIQFYAINRSTFENLLN